MKRVVASAGVFALGAAGLQGQNVTGLTPQEQAKRWIVSASLRGFYDDNSLNQVEKDPGFGFELHPGVSLNLPFDRTLVGASYDFTLNYYAARPSGRIDQDHTLDLDLNHKFSERYDLVAKNTFIYSDAPAIGEELTSTFQRREATSIRNRFAVALNSRLTPVFGLSAGYKNNVQDYFQSQKGRFRLGDSPSLSALLDLVEHQFNVDAQWYTSPQTILFTGYRIGFIEYTSSDQLGFDDIRAPVPPEVFPERRNNLSHSFYLGANREFSRRLSTAGRVGAQVTDYYNEDAVSWSPYVEGTVTYTYRPGSIARFNLNVVRIPVDVAEFRNGEVTRDGLAVAPSASLNHRFAARLSGGVNMSYSHVVYNGGPRDGESYDYLTFDTRLEYKLREHLFIDLGYIWAKYTASEQSYAFTRNRVYFGVRATY